MIFFNREIVVSVGCFALAKKEAYATEVITDGLRNELFPMKSKTDAKLA